MDGRSFSRQAVSPSSTKKATFWIPRRGLRYLRAHSCRTGAERFYEESLNHYQELLEEQQRHQAEKENILKDLHDGIGGITTNIKLLAELAQKQDGLSVVRRSLSTIADLSRKACRDPKLHSEP